MTGFNLRKIKTLNTFYLPILDEKGDPTGVVFTLAGPAHKERKAILHENQRAVIERSRETGKVEMPDAEESDKRQPSQLARLTLGWDGYVDDAGQSIAYSRETAQQLYADPEMHWLAEQVDGAYAKKSLHTKRV